MAIIGLSLEATRDYESKFDPARGTPEATKFILGTLDSRVAGKLRDLATTVMVDPNKPDDEVATKINMEDVNFQTVQFGARWENLVDTNGNAIECNTKNRSLGGKSYKVVDPDTLRLIPMAVIRELADEIRKVNELDEDAAKN